MTILKATTSILGILFILGTTQEGKAAAIQPIVPATPQDNIVLVGHGHGGHGHGGHGHGGHVGHGGGGHWHGGHVGHGHGGRWHGGHGWNGHGRWNGGGWWGGVYYAPGCWILSLNGILVPCSYPRTYYPRTYYYY